MGDIDSGLLAQVDERVSALEQSVKGNYTKEFKGDIASTVAKITQQLAKLESDNELIRKFFNQCMYSHNNTLIF